MTPQPIATAPRDGTSDFDLCEAAIRALCTREQLCALGVPPRWHLHPPQREEFTTPEGYALGMRAYAVRVLSENGGNRA